MTTIDLYKKLKAGEITEQKFLYEVRRDPNLPFITNVNNFKDSVQILKNKGIIKEEKLEVELFAKTIDMVNPYEYSRGMNFELDVVIDSVGNKLIDGATGNNVEEITSDQILKAQKKVLKNLTKDPYFYQKKLIPKMEGESEDVVEVTPKSIEALKKKAGKVIREHGENYGAVADVDPKISPLEEDEDTQAYVMALDMYKNAKGTSDEKKALDNLKKVSKEKLGVQLPLDEINEAMLFSDGEMDSMLTSDPDKLKKFFKSADYGTRSNFLNTVLTNFKNAKSGADRKKAGENVANVSKAMGIPINPDDLMETSLSIEELGRTRDAIYEKYAKQYEVDVNELKDRLEAYKLEKEQITYNVDKPEDAKKVDAKPGDTVNVGMNM
jgi:acyl carrier protein